LAGPAALSDPHPARKEAHPTTAATVTKLRRFSVFWFPEN
jgi:hypothetical protein